MPSRVLPVRPAGLFLAMVALAGLGGPAGASAAVPAPTLKLLAGTGVPGYLGDGGPAVGAQLDAPMGVAVDAAGDVLVADLSNRIRKITPDGIVTTVAGSGIAGFAGDGGPATNAQLNHPTGVVVDAAGGILIADQHNYRVRRVDTDGTITTVAGTGFDGYGLGDGGPATQAGLDLPTTLAIDAQGGILVAEMGERRVRRIDPDGTISTIAGDSGSGYDGDNKPATKASLTKPTGLAVTLAGDVLIADQGDQRVRRVDPAGVIHTIAGNGLDGHHGRRRPGLGGEPQQPDEPARGPLASRARHRRRIEHPRALDRTRRHDQHHRRWRHEPPANGLLATSAALSGPTGMAIDHTGGVIVAATGLHQLWTLLPARASARSLAGSSDEGEPNVPTQARHDVRDPRDRGRISALAGTAQAQISGTIGGDIVATTPSTCSATRSSRSPSPRRDSPSSARPDRDQPCTFGCVYMRGASYGRVGDLSAGMVRGCAGSRRVACRLDAVRRERGRVHGQRDGRSCSGRL